MVAMKLNYGKGIVPMRISKGDFPIIVLYTSLHVRIIIFQFATMIMRNSEGVCYHVDLTSLIKTKLQCILILYT